MTINTRTPFEVQSKVLEGVYAARPSRFSPLALGTWTLGHTEHVTTLVHKGAQTPIEVMREFYTPPPVTPADSKPLEEWVTGSGYYKVSKPEGLDDNGTRLVYKVRDYRYSYLYGFTKPTEDQKYQYKNFLQEGTARGYIDRCEKLLGRKEKLTPLMNALDKFLHQYGGYDSEGCDGFKLLEEADAIARAIKYE